MTTVSAMVPLFAETMASVAVLNMDDAGDIAPAACANDSLYFLCLSGFTRSSSRFITAAHKSKNYIYPPKGYGYQIILHQIANKSFRH